jgi:hypothetical protein
MLFGGNSNSNAKALKNKNPLQIEEDDKYRGATSVAKLH